MQFRGLHLNILLFPEPRVRLLDLPSGVLTLGAKMHSKMNRMTTRRRPDPDLWRASRKTVSPT